MKHNFKLLIIVLSLMVTTNIYSQSVELFGFYQAKFTYEPTKVKFDLNIPGVGKVRKTDDEYEYLSPSLQQLNFMFSNQFTSNVSSFISLELVNSFSSDKDWGSINLEEAWLKYDYAQNHSLKGGWLIPRFNYLNEIKNKMPLIPYISRPAIYEPSLRSVLKPEDYLPEVAFIQFDGKFYKGPFEFNYALFSGPAESSYFSKNSNISGVHSGKDTTGFLMFGGRLGVNYKWLRLGVSATKDKKNLQATLKEDANRTRLGVDFGVNINNLWFEAEYLKVMIDVKNTTDNMDKEFYYATLGYDFTSKIFAFGYYNFIKDNQKGALTQAGFNKIVAGAGYRALDNVVIKLEYSQITADGKLYIPAGPVLLEGDLDFTINYLSLALSVLF